jgi:hypothetical protein
MPRSPDTEFRATVQAASHFEDLTERCAVKLTSLLRITGPPHYNLWQEQVGGPHFRERTGQFIPIYAMDLEVTDEPVETRQAFDVDVTIRLGCERGADGRVQRLLSEGETAVWAHRASGGERVCVGRTRKQSVFTRPDPDPAQRRVTELHPYMQFSGLPTRAMHLITADELLAPPEGYEAADAGLHRDADPHVWSYQQTDPNQHIHAMEYVRALEHFATDHLARLGRAPRHFFFDRARVLFRRPCFTGDFYRRCGRLYLSPDGSRDLFIGRLSRVLPEGPPDVDEAPAVVIQLAVRNRPSGPPHA